MKKAPKRYYNPSEKPVKFTATRLYNKPAPCPSCGSIYGWVISCDKDFKVKKHYCKFCHPDLEEARENMLLVAKVKAMCKFIRAFASSHRKKAARFMKGAIKHAKQKKGKK